MKYDVLVEPTTKGWSGCVLGPAVAGLGDTIEATIQNLQDGVDLYVEAMAEDNQPLPPRRTYDGPPLEPGGRIIPDAIEIPAPQE